MKKLGLLVVFLLSLPLWGCKNPGENTIRALEVVPSVAEMLEGESGYLAYRYSPQSVTGLSFEWSSDNEQVATVTEDGFLTAVHKGEAVITLVCKPQGKTATCKVSVQKDIPGFSGGAGTAADPYRISCSADILSMRKAIADNTGIESAHFVQTADIDIHSLQTSICADEGTSFKGTYDGGNHSIGRLSIPLFGYIGAEGSVKNLVLDETCVLEGEKTFIGGVARICSGEISGVTFKGSIYVTGYKTLNYYGDSGVDGGIVGHLDGGRISDCTLTGSVQCATASGRFVGGIVGIATDAIIERCTAAADSYVFNWSYDVAGIAGGAFGTDIIDCVCEARINSGRSFAAGIAGKLSSGTIRGCVTSSRAVITSYQSTSGGIVGYIYPDHAGVPEVCVVDNCAAYCPVSCQYAAGGIVGYVAPHEASDEITISNCLYKGELLKTTGVNSSNGCIVGGIVGWIFSTAAAGKPPVVIANCASLDLTLEGVPSAGVLGYFGGICGYDNYVSFKVAGCYSNIGSGDMLVGGDPISTSTYTGFGGTYGTTVAANSNYSACYWLDDVPMGKDAASAQCSNCSAMTMNQMKDGTLLSKLGGASSSVSALGVRPAAWVASDSGYPVQQGIPADPAGGGPRKTRVSVLGDSISSYVGVIDSEYRPYYPKGDVTSVQKTYWYQLVYNYMTNATLDRNISSSSTQVTPCYDESQASTTWYNNDFVNRVRIKGLGKTDVLILNGGTNDFNHRSCTPLAPGHQILVDGTEIPSDSEFDAMFATCDAANTREQTETLPDATFCQAYMKLLQMIKVRYPQMKVVCVITDAVCVSIEKSIQKIADHFGYAVADCYSVNGCYRTPDDPSKNPFPKEGSCHPNAQGHAAMAKFIWECAGAYIQAE